MASWIYLVPSSQCAAADGRTPAEICKQQRSLEICGEVQRLDLPLPGIVPLSIPCITVGSPQTTTLSAGKPERGMTNNDNNSKPRRVTRVSTRQETEEYGPRSCHNPGIVDTIRWVDAG